MKQQQQQMKQNKCNRRGLAEREQKHWQQQRAAQCWGWRRTRRTRKKRRESWREKSQAKLSSSFGDVENVEDEDENYEREKKKADQKQPPVLRKERGQ